MFHRMAHFLGQMTSRLKILLQLTSKVRLDLLVPREILAYRASRDHKARVVKKVTRVIKATLVKMVLMA